MDVGQELGLPKSASMSIRCRSNEHEGTNREMALPEAYFRAEVVGVRPLSAVMRRIVLGGEGLAGYRSSGAPDERLRLLVPPERQRHVQLPVRQGQRFRFADPQPVPRWFSLRRWDPRSREATLDIVVRDIVGHSAVGRAAGPATRWAEEAEPGDQVLISQPHGNGIDSQADWLLILADQTGIPAACRILASLAPWQHAHAVFEAPNEAATFTPSSPANLKVCWAYNPSPDKIPSPLSAAVRTVGLPPGRGYVWMAGEAGCALTVRRYFRDELAWQSDRYDIAGYWSPDPESPRTHYLPGRGDQVSQPGRPIGADHPGILDKVWSVSQTQGR